MFGTIAFQKFGVPPGDSSRDLFYPLVEVGGFFNFWNVHLTIPKTSQKFASVYDSLNLGRHFFHRRIAAKIDQTLKMVTSSSPKKNIALWAPQPLPTQNATNKNMFKQKVLHHSAFLHPFLDDRLPTRTETPFRSPVKLVVWWMQFLERIRRLKIYQEIPWRKSPFRETQRHFPAKRKSVEIPMAERDGSCQCG